MIRLRHERGWNQSDLVAHLQLRGCEITRAIVANIETGRSRATDVLVFEIAMVFGISPASLFPASRPGQPQPQLGITPFTARRRRRLAPQAGGIMEDTLLVLKGQAQVASG
jgi:transcriptional regulator with XRE-family HTH domain